MKKKITTIDLCLILEYITVIAFTITMIIIFCKYQAIPGELVVCFFALFSGETGALTYIWKVKKKAKEKEEGLYPDE